MNLVEVVNNLNQDRDFPEVYPGDYVRVHVEVVEGDRRRIQVFHGTVIRNRGNGQNRTFTVRRIASHGIGVERTFLYKSPRIEKIEITRHNRVRRAQLYYMRELRGKSARLQEVRVVNRNKPKHKNKLKEETLALMQAAEAATVDAIEAAEEVVEEVDVPEVAEDTPKTEE